MVELFEKEVCKNLIALRKYNGMTLEDLAKKTGVATTTISRYENGNCHMNLNMLERIVNGNGQTLEIFFANVLAKMQ